MTAQVEATPHTADGLAAREKAQTDRRVDLNLRFLLAGLENTELLEDIPRGVTLFLLPDDDPDFVEREIAFAAKVALGGEDVYLRHVRVANLPEPPPVSLDPTPGQRWVTYGPNGEITKNRVFGEDRAWHETDEPPPGPRDDPPW